MNGRSPWSTKRSSSDRTTLNELALSFCYTNRLGKNHRHRSDCTGVVHFSCRCFRFFRTRTVAAAAGNRSEAFRIDHPARSISWIIDHLGVGGVSFESGGRQVLLKLALLRFQLEGRIGPKASLTKSDFSLPVQKEMSREGCGPPTTRIPAQDFFKTWCQTRQRTLVNHVARRHRFYPVSPLR